MNTIGNVLTLVKQEIKQSKEGSPHITLLIGAHGFTSRSLADLILKIPYKISAACLPNFIRRADSHRLNLDGLFKAPKTKSVVALAANTLEMPMHITAFTCAAGDAIESLRFAPSGSTMLAAVDASQSFWPSSMATLFTNTMFFSGNQLKFTMMQAFFLIKYQRFKNNSPIFAFKNSDGVVITIDFQAKLENLLERLVNMEDPEFKELKDKFVKAYSIHEPDFHFDHLAKTISQIGNISRSYHLKEDDLEELATLEAQKDSPRSRFRALVGKEITKEDLKNRFHAEHQKVVRFDSEGVDSFSGRSEIPYQAARILIGPILQHAIANLECIKSLLDPSLGKWTIRERLKDNFESLVFIQIELATDISINFQNPAHDDDLNNSRTSISIKDLSKFLVALRQIIINQYMDAQANPSIANYLEARAAGIADLQDQRLFIENEFFYKLRPRYEGTPEGWEVTRAFKTLDDILRGQLPGNVRINDMDEVEPVVETRKLGSLFNSEYARAERIKANRLFNNLEKFRSNPEDKDRKSILNMDSGLISIDESRGVAL